MIELVLARLREPSTWRGLVWLFTSAGITLQPAAWEYLTTIGMAVAGLIGVLTSERSADSSTDATLIHSRPSERGGESIVSARFTAGVRQPIERPLDD